MTALERFLAKVNKTETCWLWTGGCSPKGYGYFYFLGKSTPAHRVSYTMFVGPIPAGLHIDHVEARGCTNRHCVNPAHLEAVTMQENLRRGKPKNNGQAAKTHCKRGHPFDDVNTYRSTKQRHCRACSALRARAYRAKEQAA